MDLIITESPEDRSIGMAKEDESDELEDELVEIINGEESPIVKKRTDSTEEEKALRKKKNEEELEKLKKEFEELWAKTIESPKTVSPVLSAQKGLPKLQKNNSFHAKLSKEKAPFQFLKM